MRLPKALEPSGVSDSWGLFVGPAREEGPMSMFDDFGQIPSGGPMRVLIAEDETIIRLDLRGMLEKHGLVVVAEARNGAEAVDLARAERPDVAVLDLRMPELDGIEAARRMYAERPLPIVMLT